MKGNQRKTVIIDYCNAMPETQDTIICKATTEGNALLIVELLNTHCKQNNIGKHYTAIK